MYFERLERRIFLTIDRRQVLLASCLLLLACKETTFHETETNSIYEAFSKQFFSFIDLDEKFEILGSGYQWSEGPAWDNARQRLYFTDVPQNIAYSWDAENGVQKFLMPSGADVSEGFREPGANGLYISREGQLLICNHGTRSVEAMDIETKIRTTLSDNFNGMLFNSPNDLIEGPDGTIYFTDPPYGLANLDESTLKELKINGVYALATNRDISPLIKDLMRPNGIGLSPNGKTLYVAQSAPNAQHIYTLDLTDPMGTKAFFADLSIYAGEDSPGLPDGMAIDYKGNLFATGPGGIFIINPSGEILGRIKTGKGSANCTFGEDGSTLFITNHDRLIKLKTKTRGLQWT